MTRLAIIGRHGNTFLPHEKVVMVGAKQDLPLTDEGRSQANAVGVALKPLREEIGIVRAGPLKRTREFAQIILDTLAVSKEVVIDQRLIEIDYGAWGGLSDDEIVALTGSHTPLKAWQERGVRPEGVTFTPSPDELERDTKDLLEQLSGQEGVSLVITSNGRLRELGRLLGNDPHGSWKVGTGKLCILKHVGSSWRIIAWNIAPDQLSRVLQEGSATS
jgi:broad specificity phosphatase PhoE